ncbi:uncharacterized protein LOC111630998 [Centruroides sculpturatus]|uniref:uncharacterized protein LOC111615902 n=1 Tax=Centruroides sculpturatus TaxID=218467 RepID=UPI000C6E35A1|nr:uncharacterized protein LOC111615902 [Centruroides sculpturatus]XP_023213110.1 uncharacterized protein LOC111615902 [Centruroides sculpturatus]XP_023230945.1 uncharacterized protein LOC111630998 [Centruroides sculpturatus]
MANNTRMDYLLAELKRETTKLRQQGDCFQQQMCQMYSILKDVIKNHERKGELLEDDRHPLTVTNPLLDTINTLTCESDDYYDLIDWKSDNTCNNYVAYAGSVDSGYKSHCPTPELNEICYNYTPSYSSRSNKPKIVMGTKVIGRHQTANEISNSKSKEAQEKRQGRRSSCEHENNHFSSQLSYAKEKLAQSNDVTTNYLNRATYDKQLSRSSRMVRFSETVKTLSRSKRNRNTPKSRKSKSILKDPVCNNLKSRLTPASGYTLEEEIDNILHGKLVYYDLDKVEFPDGFSADDDCLIERNVKDLPTTPKNSTLSLNVTKTGPIINVPKERNKINQTGKMIPKTERKLINNSNSTKATNDDKSDESSTIPRVSDGQLHHIYEEIIYNTESRSSNKEEPPPLPSRPRLLKMNSTSYNKNMKDYPKQRSNIYRLITDKVERMNISQSLETEWKYNAESQSFH